MKLSIANFLGRILNNGKVKIKRNMVEIILHKGQKPYQETFIFRYEEGMEMEASDYLKEQVKIGKMSSDSFTLDDFDAKLLRKTMADLLILKAQRLGRLFKENDCAGADEESM